MTMHTSIKPMDPALALRMERAVTLGLALRDADPQDAAALCAAFLIDNGAGMPGLDPWGDVRADAEFWADAANPVELNLYACAALRRLGQRVQCLDARKRLMAAIWASLPQTERTAFLRRVQGRAG